MFLNTRILLLFLFLITACTKKLPEHNFNTKAWIADARACKNERLNLLPELEKLRPALNGITNSQLRELLGRPEATTIADQSEKIFYYYLEPGTQCQEVNRLSAANKLWVRINAMQIVKETGYENPLPDLN